MKKGMVAWIVVGVLLVAGTLYWGSQNIIICWDGIEVDEPLLIEQCGITQEEYFSGDMSGDGCAEESGAIRYVGSCDPDWTLISVQTAGVGLAYLAISALFFGIRKLLQRSK